MAFVVASTTSSAVCCVADAACCIGGTVVSAVGCVACAGLRCAGDACCNLVRRIIVTTLVFPLFLTIIFSDGFCLLATVLRDLTVTD